MATVQRQTNHALRSHSRAVAGPDRRPERGWAAYNEGLAEHAKKVDEKCGTKLESSYDLASYPKSFDPLTDLTRSSCETAVGTLSEVCRTAPGKETVLAKVKKTVCKITADETRVTLDGTTLTVHINPAKRSSITGLKKGSYSWVSALKEIL